MKQYILWTKYGLEGWQPTEFETKEELIKFILQGGIYGEIKITKVLDLRIDVSEK